jgi:tetratricopeptide (TPR) repeat protein
LKKDKSKDQYPIRNLKEDQASFLWFYQCHNFMIKLENDDNKKAKQEMISCCRQKYKEDRIQSSIDEFNKQSLDDNAKHAIRLYTENSFIYQCTNNVLRKQNISQVYSYRYIIKLICRQLKEQHKQFIQEYKEVEKKSSLHLYRGQNLKLEDIRFLKRNINNLISLNGFVSTTRDERIAMEFVKHHIYEGLESVLMKIDVDMTSEHGVTFADISKFSKYPEEREVLLSVGTVFRVKSVDLDKNQQLYIVHLELSQHDQLTVNKYIEQTYAKHVDSNDQSVLFGKLLCDMGECESAIKYFLDALECLSDHNNQFRAVYLNNIGVCHNEMGRKDEAFKCYNGALKIYQQINDQRGLSACQHNVSNLFR